VLTPHSRVPPGLAARAADRLGVDGTVVPLLRDRILTRRDPADYTDLDWLYQHQPKMS